MRITLTGLTFATAMRVIKRIHRQTSYGRLYPQPTLSSGLTQIKSLMLNITDLTNSSMTI
jgi:hypothetical protein